MAYKQIIIKCIRTKAKSSIISAEMREVADNSRVSYRTSPAVTPCSKLNRRLNAYSAHCNPAHILRVQ